MKVSILVSLMLALGAWPVGCANQSNRSNEEKGEPDKGGTPSTQPAAAEPATRTPLEASPAPAPEAVAGAAAAASDAPPANLGPPVITAREMIPGDGKLLAVFDTSMGKIEVELLEKEAPLAVANFVGLATGKHWFRALDGKIVKRPFYDGTIFHRVIPRFMIQGGDPMGKGIGGPGYTFRDEPQKLLFDRPGLLAMANSGPNTNGSQFFFTEVPTVHLNGRHTIFGRIVRGEDLVAKIARVPAGPGNRPVQPVTINKVTVSRAGAR